MDLKIEITDNVDGALYRDTFFAFGGEVDLGYIAAEQHERDPKGDVDLWHQCRPGLPPARGQKRSGGRPDSASEGEGPYHS